MKLTKSILMISSLIVFSTSGLLANEMDMVKQGEKIFMTKGLGNCLACHDIQGKEVNGPGSMGPKLQYLSSWPKEEIFNKIYDPYTTNPISAMPAFGKNGWLSDNEINALVAYLQTIK
ncbi:MAG: sulfur oxidation c-type cytochrome SoxX [Campylobacteraceae bacterium]|nr:sulfur oxidation c-type cytochrome SoxX [Campylobacteraceae bacterium]